MKFSELIGKKVISLYEKSIVGVVISANFNKAKNKVFSLVIEDSRDNNMFDELFLDVKNIYSANFDAIVIKNNACLKNEVDRVDFNPLNYEVFKVNGKNVGKVQDIILDDKFNVISYSIGGEVIDCKKVAGIDNGIIILQDDNAFINLQKFKHKEKKAKVQNYQVEDNYKAVILPMYSFEEKEQKEVQEKEVKKIEQKSISINHLIGKIVTQSIVASNGERVCKVGEIVTQDVINKANAYSKLRELSFYVK